MMPKKSVAVALLLLGTLAASQFIGRGGNPPVPSSLNTSNTCTYDPTDFKVIGDSIERSLNFFEQNIEKLVLDAAVGTRSLEAQLNSILNRHPTLSLNLQQYLQYLLRKSETISNKIIQSIATSRKVSFTEKKHTLPWVTTPQLWDWPVSGKWEPFSTMQGYEPKNGFNSSTILSQSRETIEEAQSDTCIYQVFNCDVQQTSEICRKLFFLEEQSLYSLTHQVIYTLFAKKKQCFRAINSDDLRRYQEKLCGKVWLEANAISESGYPHKFLDLFVEQVAICGMTGYPNFFRRDWLMQILRWQSPQKSGCFLEIRSAPPLQNVSQLLRLYHTNQSKFREIMNKHYNEQQKNNFEDKRKVTSRQKRSDAFLRQGLNGRDTCSVHFTAVGITALGVHLRYLVDTCFTQ